MKPIQWFLGLFALLMTNSLISNASDPSTTKYLTSPEALKANLPFSEAVQVGNMLYLSGQIGLDPVTGKLAPGGITPETRQTMENIKATLTKYGSSMDKVVKCTVFIEDIAKWGELNKVYVTYFKQHFPARSALGADGLALGSAVEIECFATID